MTVGTKCAEGDGIFALRSDGRHSPVLSRLFCWKGRKRRQSAFTVEEAVHLLEEMPPERLGLSGSDMSSYLLFPEEGS